MNKWALIAIAVGVPLAFVVGVVAVIGGVASILTAPTPADAYRVLRTSCVVTADGRDVLIEAKLQELDEFPSLQTARLVDPEGARLDGYGWLAPSEGFAPDEVAPSAARLSSVLKTDGQPDRTPPSTANLVVRIHPIGAPARLTVRALGLTVAHGEPVFYQEVLLHLTVSHGKCTLDNLSR